MLVTPKCEVWGDPIEHSRSPELHRAAYDVLDLPWQYEKRRVSEADFTHTLASLGPRYRGLSLTMPLKSAGFRACIRRDRHAQLTGAVNTMLLTEHGPRGLNTDVGGLIAALGEEGLLSLPAGRIVGAGATATSALVALAELGAKTVDIVARRPEAAHHLRSLGEQLNVDVQVHTFDSGSLKSVPVTIATLPGDATVPVEQAALMSTNGGLLYDVVYGQWPTTIGAAWQHGGGEARSGLTMLLHQAVLQVRAFTSGNTDVPLRKEDAVIAKMRAALVGG